MSAVLYSSSLNRGQIKLLRLHPGGSAEPVCSDLFTVSLDKKPDYQALSYVWGDPDITKPITLCNQTHLVTINLESALRHLRYETADRIIWVDAVCINQGDVSERNEQVNQMGRIYSQAHEVVVWLGNGSDETEAAIDAIEALGTDESLHWVAPRRPYYSGKSYIVALLNLLNCPWWHRIWTVQEFVLAKSLTFVCGKRSMAGDMITNIGLSFTNHGHTCCPVLGTNTPAVAMISAALQLTMFRNSRRTAVVLGQAQQIKIETTALQEQIQQTETIMIVREQAKQKKIGQVNKKVKQLLRMQIDAREFANAKGHGRGGKFGNSADAPNLPYNLLAHLHSHQTRQCHDARDRVYGFLGLGFGSSENLLRAEYNLDILQVYAKFAFRVILQQKNLDIFSHLQSRRIPSECPTWAPDWRQVPDFRSAHMISMRFPYLSKFDACRSSFRDTTVFSDRVLCLDGVVIDSIVHTGSDTSTGDRWSRIQDWWTLLDLHKHPNRVYVGGGDRKDAYCRTILSYASDLYDRSQPVPSWLPAYVHRKAEVDFRKEFRHPPVSMGCVQRLIKAVTDWHGERRPSAQYVPSHELDTRIAHAVYMRRLIVSEKGYIGVAPIESRVGDKICILFGGRLPLIIRETAEPVEIDGVQHVSHTMVGESHVHGLMYGEGIDMLDRGEATLQKFFLV